MTLSSKPSKCPSFRDLANILHELHGVTFPSSIEDCHACKVAKATKLSHESSYRRATKPFELIHTDVQGSILPFTYPNNEEYIIAIVHDFPRYSFLYEFYEK